MHRLLSASSAATLLFATVVACSPSNPAVGSVRPSERDEILVEVNNQHWLDATVWIRFEGSPLQRLGLIEGQSRDTFSIQYQPGRFIFTIDLIGSGEFITEPPISAHPDDEFELRLPSNLDRGAGGFRRVIR